MLHAACCWLHVVGCVLLAVCCWLCAGRCGGTLTLARDEKCRSLLQDLDWTRDIEPRLTSALQPILDARRRFSNAKAAVRDTEVDVAIRDAEAALRASASRDEDRAELLGVTVHAALAAFVRSDDVSPEDREAFGALFFGSQQAVVGVPVVASNPAPGFVASLEALESSASAAEKTAGALSAAKAALAAAEDELVAARAYHHKAVAESPEELREFYKYLLN